MIEKAERFSPSASRKHRAKADAAYAEALSAGDSDWGQTARAVSGALPEDAARTDSAEPDGGGQ